MSARRRDVGDPAIRERLAEFQATFDIQPDCPAEDLAEAESVPGPILEIGNTNSRYRFACGAREFTNRWNSHGPAHHGAVGLGHVADTLAKLGSLLQLDVVRVI